MSAAPSVPELRIDAAPQSAPRLSRFRVKLRGQIDGSTLVSVYVVTASTPYEAYFTALRSEPTFSRRSMVLAECDFVERVSGSRHKVGVEKALARFSVPPTGGS